MALVMGRQAPAREWAAQAAPRRETSRRGVDETREEQALALQQRVAALNQTVAELVQRLSMESADTCGHRPGAWRPAAPAGKGQEGARVVRAEAVAELVQRLSMESDDACGHRPLESAWRPAAPAGKAQEGARVARAQIVAELVQHLSMESADTCGHRPLEGAWRPAAPAAPAGKGQEGARVVRAVASPLRVRPRSSSREGVAPPGGAPRALLRSASGGPLAMRPRTAAAEPRRIFVETPRRIGAPKVYSSAGALSPVRPQSCGAATMEDPADAAVSPSFGGGADDISASQLP